MVPSELADDLQIPLSVMRRRINTYCRLAEIEIPKRLDAQMIEHLREVDRTIKARKDLSIVAAVELVLGVHTPDLPGRYVADLMAKIDALVDANAKVQESLDRQSDYLRQLLKARQPGADQ